MLSIQEIKLLIEKLKKLEKVDFHQFVKQFQTHLEDLAYTVDLYNNEQIQRIDKSKEWYQKDLDWRESNREFFMSPLLEKEIITKINQFAKMGNNHQSCLQIGPGYGHLTLHLRPWRRIFILDVLINVFSKIKKKFNPKHHLFLKFFTTERTACDDIPNNSMAFVFSWDTFPFFTLKHIDEYLNDIHRVMLPGGYGFIHYADCNQEADLHEANRGYWNFNTKEEFSKLLVKNKFEILEMSQFKPLANYVIFKKPGKENVVVYKSFEIPVQK